MVSTLGSMLGAFDLAISQLSVNLFPTHGICATARLIELL